MDRKLIAKALSFFLACLAIGFGLNFARPMLIGEEWMYRDESLNLLDSTTDLLSQYSMSVNDYSHDVIDLKEFKKRIGSSDSSIKNIDSEAHKLTPPKRYEDFNDHFMKGIHGAYDIFFYMSLWAKYDYEKYNTTKSIDDLNATMNEISYAKSTMPEPETPRSIDPAWIGNIIIVVGAMIVIVYVVYRHVPRAKRAFLFCI